MTNRCFEYYYFVISLLFCSMFLFFFFLSLKTFLVKVYTFLCVCLMLICQGSPYRKVPVYILEYLGGIVLKG